MEHPYILNYIQQRMQELGINKFHFDSNLVNNIPFGPFSQDAIIGTVDTDERYGQRVAKIDASNQYLYLVQKTVPADLKITSDTGYLMPSESANYSNYTFHNFREFTGQVFITSGADFELEFVRVTPYED